jgi:hypothetical protein
MVTVIDTNEISLNGVYYPITRPIRSTLASIYPAKVVIGDTTKDDQLRSSIVAWADWRGGIGVNRMEGASDVNRAWFSTCQLRYKNHLVLANLATATTTPGHSLGQATIGAIETFGGEVYVAWNGGSGATPEIYVYANGNDSWGSALTTSGITDAVTDSIVFTDTLGTSYLVFAHYDSVDSGYSYSTNGTSWTTDATNTKFLTVWDDRLWGISHEGQLWSAATVGTEYNDAMLPLPDGSITALFVARNAMGIPVIYAATTEGLFAHDADNAMWVATQFTLPVHPDNGKGSIRWRDSVYIPSGNGIYKYINGSNTAVVTVVGPDRDDGMPSDKRGSIRSMAGSHNELLIGVDAQVGAADVAADAIPRQWQSHVGSTVMASDSGLSTILGYNELGWETKWISGTVGQRLDTMHVSTAYNSYRVWWGINGVVYFMDLPKDIINPSEVDDFAYATSGVHETPWFNAGQSEVDKLALNLRIECQDLTANEKVKIEYATDYSESYTTAVSSLDLSTMGSASGTYTYTFASGVGTPFRSIKFKLTLYRSTATTTGLEKFNSPDVVSLTMEWRKKLTAKWGHTAEVDLNRPYKGKEPKDLRSALITAIESTTLVEFTFRDDSGGTRNYYVDVMAAVGMEYTGRDERGTTQISVVEP